MSKRTNERRAPHSGAGLIADGLATLAMVVLAFLAFDDITTDIAASFPLEYSCLLAAAVWCLVFAVRLLRVGRFVLAGVSLLALGSAIWGQSSVGPSTVPSWQPEYVATVGALGWFLGLSFFLVVSGFRVALPSRPSV